MRRAAVGASGGSQTVSLLLDYIDDALVIIDLQGAITGWSHGAEQLLGYSSSEALGKDCTELYADDERSTHRALCQKVALGDAPASVEATLKSRAGESLAARIELTLTLDAGGAPACIIARILPSRDAVNHPDVSRSQIRELWTLLDSAPIAFSHLDANRRFLYINKAALRHLGAEGKNIIGRHLQDVFGEAQYQRLLPQVDLVLQGHDSHSEIDVTDETGQTRHFYRHLYPHRDADGSIKGYFSAILDVTTAKVTQESLLRREQLLRSTLVREINHRVKNSLQGLIGMMRLNATRQAPGSSAIDQCVSQLMAVAVAFGLASRHGEAQILLCDMVMDIAHNVEQVSQRRIQVELSPAAVRQPVALSERHGANISLVINELIYNAIKHSATAEGPRGVKVTVDRDARSATFGVSNESGRLPEGFSLENGTGLGTGLKLIKVLVPPEACDLKIEQRGPGVNSTLTLRPPVLSIA